MSVRATMRRTWPVLLSYAVFSMWGVCCLGASLVLTAGGLGLEPGAWGVLGGIIAAVAVGHILGNILGLIGFRMAPVTIIFFAGFMAAAMSAAVLGPFALFLFVAIIAAYGGYLGIASRLDVMASWYPLSLCVGGAILWMNAHRAVATFITGQKYALWDAFTIVCLAGGVFWMLVFLATRNSLGLTVWQEVARPKMADATGEDAVAVARPGRGSILVLMAFTIVVLGATALVSPYLFRTSEDKNGKDGDPQAQQHEQQGKGQSQREGDGSGYKGKKTKGKGHSTAKSRDGEGNGKGKSKSKQRRQGRGQGQGQSDGEQDDASDGSNDPDSESASEAAQDAAKLGLKILAYLLAAAAFLLFLYLAVLPPVRRAFLMRHLEKPLWPVSPTSRVMNHWRRALAVLAVVPIEPAAGETATDFAARAKAEIFQLFGCETPGLADAAAIVERISYAGRGLGRADEQAVREAIDQFVLAIKPRIKLRSRFAAAWGRAPEVEAN